MSKVEKQREYRKTPRGKDVEKAHNQKLKGSMAIWAKSRIYLLVRNETLPKASDCYCVDCWETAECYDHRNYHKPYQIEPVCRSCNAKRGKAIGWNELKKAV